ncbi:MAG TPA: hypothetical protein VGG93_06090, partial [Candidatus Udaeobacter sp.]
SSASLSNSQGSGSGVGFGLAIACMMLWIFSAISRPALPALAADGGENGLDTGRLRFYMTYIV